MALRAAFPCSFLFFLLASARIAFVESSPHGPSPPPPPGFVTRSGSAFMLDGKPFRYGGTNVYYLHYKTPFMVDDALSRAAASNFTVVRAWTFLLADKGDCATAEPPFFQCWNSTSRSVQVQSSALSALDYAIASASRHGLRLVLTFTNNWPDFGGSDAYLTWLEASNGTLNGTLTHSDFYTNPLTKQWYKEWVTALLTRVNTVTGVAYKDDPTIFAWQLMNEPRCQGSGHFPAPSSSECSNATLVAWVEEMGAFVKSLDPYHMLSVGDEGFYSSLDGCGGQWWCDNYTGVDTQAFAQVADVDYVTAHLYPESWGTKDIAAQWGSAWIANHTMMAHSVPPGGGGGGPKGKPFVLEEFGIANVTGGQQPAIYGAWTQTALTSGANAFHFWMLAGLDDGGKTWYPGDGLNIYCVQSQTDPPIPAGHDGTTCALLSAAAKEMMGSA